MNDSTTGSKPLKLSKKDIGSAFAVFAATFFPIFANELLQNWDLIQNFVLEWISSMGLPEFVDLLLIPGVVSLFVLGRNWLRDNSEK